MRVHMRAALAQAAFLVAFAVVAAPFTFATANNTAPVARAQPQTCFNETGFCIANSAFQNYFDSRGGARVLGFPVSSGLTLDGFTVQFFQRVVLQLQDNSIQRLNVLDQAIMPMTRANGSIFPGVDAAIVTRAPNPSDPDYVPRLLTFLDESIPDTWQGQPVRFRTLFNTT